MLGLPQFHHDDQSQRRRHRANQKQVTPCFRDGAGALQLSQQHARKSSHHIADSGQRLRRSQRMRPGSRRHHFRNQRNAHGELSAHAQAAQEAVDIEIP